MMRLSVSGCREQSWPMDIVSLHRLTLLGMVPVIKSQDTQPHSSLSYMNYLMSAGILWSLAIQTITAHISSSRFCSTCYHTPQLPRPPSSFSAASSDIAAGHRGPCASVTRLFANQSRARLLQHKGSPLAYSSKSIQRVVLCCFFRHDAKDKEQSAHLPY